MQQIREIRHAGFTIKNIPDSLKFYEFLGFKEESRGVLEQYEVLKWLGVVDTRLTWIKMRLNNTNFLIELYYFENDDVREYIEQCKVDETGLHLIQFNHISLTIGNIDEFLECLFKEGFDIEMQKKASISPECDHYIAFIRDPSDNLIELVQKI